MTTRQVLNTAREQVADVTGRNVETVSGFHHDDGGGR